MTTARQMFELIEPIPLVMFFSEEPNEEMEALGFSNYWDGYFAGRAAPLGATAPPELVHAIFYNFGPGEAARHLPKVWEVTTPEAAIAARTTGAARAVRRILRDLADSPDVDTAADLMLAAATGAPTEGRPLFAAHLTIPVPDDPVARLWHAANLLREHRGDGHNVALAAHGIGGTEAHILFAESAGIPGPTFGRVHHLPKAYLDAVVDGMRARGLLDADGRLTDAGWATHHAVEELTDTLAWSAYAHLPAGDLDRLVAALTPLSERHRATGSR